MNEYSRWGYLQAILHSTGRTLSRQGAPYLRTMLCIYYYVTYYLSQSYLYLQSSRSMRRHTKPSTYGIYFQRAEPHVITQQNFVLIHDSPFPFLMPKSS